MRPLGDAGSLLFGTLIRWSVLLEVRNKKTRNLDLICRRRRGRAGKANGKIR
jgi:hypothetical protein